MEYGKYIIIEVLGIKSPVMFRSTFNHSDFLNSFHKDFIVSAGFFAVGAKPRDGDPDDISVSVWGKSTTLTLNSRKEDAALIKSVLRKEQY